MAFESVAGNLVANDTNGVNDVFVRDMNNGATLLVSVASNGIPQNQSTLGTLFVFDLSSSNLTSIATNVLASDPPPLSLGGEWTAYVRSDALFLFDIMHGTNLQVCGPVGLTNGIVRSSPVLSTNGSRLLFSASATANDAPILLSFDRTTGVFTTISVNTNGTPTTADLGSLPSLSDDGERIAYVSSAAGIVASDYNQDADVFWFDMGNGQTRLVSARAAGRPQLASHKPGSYSTPVVSANGRFLAFVSLAACRT